MHRFDLTEPFCLQIYPKMLTTNMEEQSKLPYMTNEIIECQIANAD